MNDAAEKNSKVAIVAGAGEGLGIALCKRLLAAGYLVAGLSRTATSHQELGEHFLPLVCDLTDAVAADNAISSVEQRYGKVSVYIHNAAYLLRKEFLKTSEKDFADMWSLVCLGAVHGMQRVLPNMLSAGNGVILLTGATASVKAGGGFAAFASAKFALRGLAQSLARDYAPQGIHVAHIVIDGAIWGKQAQGFGLEQSQCLTSEAIAETYLHLINQPRSAWTFELDLRPYKELF